MDTWGTARWIRGGQLVGYARAEYVDKRRREAGNIKKVGSVRDGVAGMRGALPNMPPSNNNNGCPHAESLYGVVYRSSSALASAPCQLTDDRAGMLPRPQLARRHRHPRRERQREIDSAAEPGAAGRSQVPGPWAGTLGEPPCTAQGACWCTCQAGQECSKISACRPGVGAAAGPECGKARLREPQLAQSNRIRSRSSRALGFSTSPLSSRAAKGTGRGTPSQPPANPRPPICIPSAGDGESPLLVPRRWGRLRGGWAAVRSSARVPTAILGLAPAYAPYRTADPAQPRMKPKAAPGHSEHYHIT